MKRGTIEEALRDFGLTKKESEVYIFLGKRGPLKGGDVAKQIKMNKGQVYRTLKSLQKKGLVEATLEYPTRFTAVPFAKIIDSFIKAKQEEVALVEERKKALIDDWENISQTELQFPLEKFAVIEGTKKIYQKISQMVKETTTQLSAISTVSDLVRADQFGVFDSAYHHPLKSKVQFRFLTELSNQNLKAMKLLRAKLKAGLDFRGRNPDLGLTAFPRLVIRDGEELIFFITRTDQEECLCTNCKSLIQAFSSVFNNLWCNSIDIEQKIMELETGKPTPKMVLIKDAENAKRKYDKFLKNARDEIMIVTSSEGLIDFYNRIVQLKEWTKRGVAIRIMAPIIEKNLKVSQKLLELCEVRHVPISYLGTTIIDGKHLFQFKYPPLEPEKAFSLPFFRNTFYANDSEYIKKTKTMLNDIWRKACVPSPVTIESIIVPTETATATTDSSSPVLKNFRKVVTFSIEDQKTPGNLTERDVLNKILRAKKNLEPIRSREGALLLASTGQAIIHPPDYFNLPDMMLHAFHVDEHSSNGGGDNLVVFLWLDTPSGFGFVPVAILGNTPSQDILKRIFRGTPAGNNFHLLMKDEFHVRIHGHTLFAGWTVQVPLFPPSYSLPPSCFLLEGFGKVKTGKLSLVYQSGFKNWIEFNAFEALVTFFHPSSQYSGPGTDGILFRDYVGEAYIPT